MALSRAAGQPGPRHTFVICIDTLHASPANSARTRESLKSLFETENAAGAQYVLIGIGRQLQVLQPATANPLEILVKLRSAAWQNAMGGLDASALSVEVCSKSGIAWASSANGLRVRRPAGSGELRIRKSTR